MNFRLYDNSESYNFEKKVLWKWAPMFWKCPPFTSVQDLTESTPLSIKPSLTTTIQQDFFSLLGMTGHEYLF